MADQYFQCQEVVPAKISVFSVVSQYFKQCLQQKAVPFAKSPVGQFIVLVVMWAVGSQFKETPTAAVQSLGSQLWVSVKAVAVLQLMQFIGSANQFLSDYKQYMGTVKEALEQLVTTNQVTATRQNVLEWRSCLQFAADWHAVKLQSAYAMWQSGSLRMPPCPAGQQFRLQLGMPLSPVDQYIAQKEISQAQVLLNEYDYALAVASENNQLLQEGKSRMSVEDQQFLKYQALLLLVLSYCYC